MSVVQKQAINLLAAESWVCQHTGVETEVPCLQMHAKIALKAEHDQASTVVGINGCHCHGDLAATIKWDDGGAIQFELNLILTVNVSWVFWQDLKVNTQ